MSEENGMELGKFGPVDEENTLDFFVEKRNGKKRNYVFDYGKSRTCDHPELKVIAHGGIVYRCQRCNYAFHLTGAYQQPLHNELIMSFFNIMSFSKEFGWDAVQEVVRRPIGQMDGMPHKPVLPEGMSFLQAINELEGVDVNAEDGGAAQLTALLEAKWVGKKERALYEADKERQALQEAKEKPALKEGDSGNADQGDDVDSGDEGSPVHPLSP